MKGFQLGDLIGKGASGVVYRALDTNSGLTVAIKKIKKQSTAEIHETMQEIVLLTKLSHENIVHMYGYEIINDELLIIMDANLLNTKQGLVKLADFGIASKLGMTKRALFEGSPYWMAPEVIELNGSSSASDIWSVGCTALELFTGKPPFYDLEPIAALFRIASSDKIPYPKAISSYFEDFLDNCFQKDPNLRISASRLLNHPWMNSNSKSLLKKQSNDKISWKKVDLELFKEISDNNDYSMDFIGDDLNLEVIDVQAADQVDGHLEETFQDIIPTKVTSQKSTFELLSKIKLNVKNKKVIADCLRAIIQTNTDNEGELDIQFACLVELEKTVNSDLLLSNEFVQVFCNCIKKLPHSVLHLAFGTFVEILLNTAISNKTYILTVLRTTLERQAGIAKEDLLLLLSTSCIPSLLLELLNRNYQPRTREYTQMQNEILSLLQLMSSSKRSVVKHLATVQNLKGLFVAIQTQRPEIVFLTLKVIKNICRVAENLDTFNFDNKIEILTLLLRKYYERRDFQMQILNSLFYLLRHDKNRQEKSISFGLLDPLKNIIQNSFPEKQFAIPILCDLVCNVDPKFLWDGNVSALFLPVLRDQCWRNTVFETIVIWYNRDTERVEEYLLDSQIFIEFFSVKYFNGNAEKQCISLLLQLISSSNSLSSKLLSEGILNYLVMADNFALVELSVDILKILSLLLKHNFALYWKSNQPKLGVVFKYLEKLQTFYDSIVIKQLAIIIRKNIKLLFTNIYSS
ncbi:hypothetical protein HDV01_006564 [Terramyces sp. JEL0728]|nr:hypothetical protein HDV01_006564 [Terramyces sp. JEL0728]